MKEPLRSVARLGFCHHTFFPCKDDPELHVDTLPRIVARDDVEVIDLTIPYGDRYRERAIRLVKGCGKAICYDGYLMPTRKIPLGTLSPTERAQILVLAKEQVDVAYEVGAFLFMQSVGADPGPEQRSRAYEGLSEYIRELSAYMRRRGSALGMQPISFAVELMDREIDRKSLCGPTAEVVAYLDRLVSAVPEVGLVPDMAHVPLMRETFEQTLVESRRYIKHIHVGNCIQQDRSHPWWGDQHPPIGIPGGEVDVPELRRILGTLWDLGYLGPAARGTLTLEIRAFPGKTVEETIVDNLGRLEQAWRELRQNPLERS